VYVKTAMYNTMFFML